jgi:hypothetical protein
MRSFTTSLPLTFDNPATIGIFFIRHLKSRD